MKTLRYTLKAGICVLYFLLPQRIYATSADSLALELLKVGNRWVYEFSNGFLYAGFALASGRFSDSGSEKGRRTITLDSISNKDSSGTLFFVLSYRDTSLYNTKHSSEPPADPPIRDIKDSLSIRSFQNKFTFEKGSFRNFYPDSLLDIPEFLKGYTMQEGVNQDFKVRHVPINDQYLTLNTLSSFTDTTNFLSQFGMISYRHTFRIASGPIRPVYTQEYKLITFNDKPVPWYELQMGVYIGVVTKNNGTSRNIGVIGGFKKSTLLFDQSKGINLTKGVGVDLCGRRLSSNAVVKGQCKGVYIQIQKDISEKSIRR
jgi:hypothetical protein